MTGAKQRKEQYKEVELEMIVEPEGRHRLEINEEEIEELAHSIESLGMRQAIEVVPREDKYEIVYGERRFLAHKRLRKKKIWVKIVELTRDEIILVRATENISRLNLTPVEEAGVLAEMRDEFKMTSEKIAKKVGLKVATVKRRLDILRMPKSFQMAIHRKLISATVAEELWRCPDAEHKEYLLELAVEHGITALVARQWVQDFARERRGKETVDHGGRGALSPMESKPVYTTCDLCQGPVDVTETMNLGICKECGEKLRQATV